jgi:hypothetical protein
MMLLFSVTAGHDSNFNQSFSQLVGPLMEPALAAVGIKAISRGGGIGNNP